MGRHKRRVSFLDGLEITAVGAEGHAIGRNDSQVVFVKYAAPGDVVDVKVTKKKKNFQEGQIIRFQKKSTDRIDPFCPVFVNPNLPGEIPLILPFEEIQTENKSVFSGFEWDF